ncbi:hypothetical protein VBM87_02605 [Mycoplasma sp. 744]|uniref:hypothetical protein n=1 Tax=Mycoplasma sp. 744 TaxID=3108531 RepID=UPI002B1E6A44|nr:hypothetical protein [Mycoplasma sp. 744]MEA4115659.1 hypothetical protein [Mycoplasma sp. 744]
MLVSSISIPTAIVSSCTTDKQTVAKEKQNKYDNEYTNRNVGEIDEKWNMPKYADYTNQEIRELWDDASERYKIIYTDLIRDYF